MNALIEPLAGELVSPPSHTLCPSCGTLFKFRSNKTYCSDRCRDNAKKRKARLASPVNAANSHAKYLDQQMKFDLALRVAERLYTMPVDQRLGYLEAIIRLAREGHSPLLRDILTSPKFLKAKRDEAHLYWRRAPAVYLTIAQAANRYTLWSPWASTIYDVVNGVTPEPSTGEVNDDGTIDDDGRGFMPRKTGDTLNIREADGKLLVHPWCDLGEQYPNPMRRVVDVRE